MIDIADDTGGQCFPERIPWSVALTATRRNTLQGVKYMMVSECEESGVNVTAALIPEPYLGGSRRR